MALFKSLNFSISLGDFPHNFSNTKSNVDAWGGRGGCIACTTRNGSNSKGNGLHRWCIVVPEVLTVLPPPGYTTGPTEVSVAYIRIDRYCAV